MKEKNKIVNKILFWINKLHYISFRIEIELEDGEYIVLQKKKSRKIGFFCDPKENNQ